MLPIPIILIALSYLSLTTNATEITIRVAQATQWEDKMVTFHKDMCLRFDRYLRDVCNRPLKPRTTETEKIEKMVQSLITDYPCPEFWILLKQIYPINPKIGSQMLGIFRQIKVWQSKNYPLSHIDIGSKLHLLPQKFQFSYTQTLKITQEFNSYTLQFQMQQDLFVKICDCQIILQQVLLDLLTQKDPSYDMFEQVLHCQSFLSILRK